MDPTKVMGRRIAALLIDVVIAIAMTSAGVATIGDPTTDNEYVVLFFLPYASFLILGCLIQGTTGGTPGKLLLGLRVIDRQTGQLPDYTQCWNRTVMWIVDWLPVLGLVGLITCATSKGHRRVGDMLAKTLVVDQADVGRPPLVPGLTAPVASGYAPSPPRLNASRNADILWDTDRNVYIFRDAERDCWLQFDETDKEWRSS